MKRAFALTAAGLVILLLAPTLAAAPKEALPKTLAGKVVAVADAYRITVLVDNCGQDERQKRKDSHGSGLSSATSSKDCCGSLPELTIPGLWGKDER